MSESVNALVFSETSGNAQQGLQALLGCIRHAISFESNRSLLTSELSDDPLALSALEKQLFQRVCKKINSDENQIVPLKPSSH